MSVNISFDEITSLKVMSFFDVVWCVEELVKFGLVGVRCVCGIVSYRIVSYRIVSYRMVWYGMVWYGMVWYGMVWYGMVWYGMVWYGMVWYGMVWSGRGGGVALSAALGGVLLPFKVNNFS